MVITLGHHRPAHQVLKKSIKDCAWFGETLNVVWVVTLDVAYHILANYSKPLPSNHRIPIRTCSAIKDRTSTKLGTTTSRGFYEKILMC